MLHEGNGPALLSFLEPLCSPLLLPGVKEACAGLDGEGDQVLVIERCPFVSFKTSTTSQADQCTPTRPHAFLACASLPGALTKVGRDVKTRPGRWKNTARHLKGPALSPKQRSNFRRPTAALPPWQV
ncbi:hypothetical protein E2C01_059939 [Portunus trituberculatus]|uniref:Uncharacterized protein n=1 Tax=Portunus trituberculatus TaxID=210409 RepID=A0A5B7H6R5_PORTR|nr:hypothetical protein [Portunus trituberculatus]